LTSLDVSSAAILTYYGAAASYTAQLLFVTPIFLVFYGKLRSDNIDRSEIAKWSALGVTGFIFGLWIKHFMLAVYAIGIDFSSVSYMVGSLNSALTLLTAGIILIAVFMPLFKKISTNYNAKVLGVAFFAAGLYATIYLAVALVNEQYMNWLSLIDWWTIIFIGLGLGFIVHRQE
ncbi:MAG TPA: hypothetical protein VMX17_01610, partial [Candidatus Glassbacteria bacterium]|nr:hypothetical protein [Candidatus Glassbacteria bacterium]